MTTKRAAKKKKATAVEDDHAGPKPPREKCAATTAKAVPCKRLAVEGSDLCAVHMGAPVGRPPKLTDTVVERLVAILKVGGYVETAAAAVGVSKQTLYNWLERGDPAGAKKADEPFRAFRQQLEQARAEGEAVLVTRIQIAGQKDWKANAWMLERINPGIWAGPRGRAIANVGHPDDPPGAAGIDPILGPPVVDDQVGPDGSPL